LKRIFLSANKTPNILQNYFSLFQLKIYCRWRKRAIWCTVF